jgi:hypothetical protein
MIHTVWQAHFPCPFTISRSLHGAGRAGCHRLGLLRALASINPPLGEPMGAFEGAGSPSCWEAVYGHHSGDC